jgi:ribosome-associated heat shock protein Hsp15
MANPDPDRGDGRADDADRGRIRFDKWLWAARFYRTRSVAAQAIDAGQARLNGERVKPAHVVRIGDGVSLRKEGIVRDVEVTSLSDRRGPAAAAALLYRETEASAAARAEAVAQRKALAATEPRFPGRPTKRDRRKIGHLLGDS